MVIHYQDIVNIIINKAKGRDFTEKESKQINKLIEWSYEDLLKNRGE